MILRNRHLGPPCTLRCVSAEFWLERIEDRETRGKDQRKDVERGTYTERQRGSYRRGHQERELRGPRRGCDGSGPAQN